MKTSSNIEDRSAVENFTMRDFLKACLPAWPWFAASLLICVGSALLYICTREPVYERSEQILVKDQDSSGGIGEIADMFSSLGLVAGNTNVNNELITFTSPYIMYEVAVRLSLDMNYLKRGGLHPVTLYGKTLPVSLVMQDVGEQESARLRLTLRPGGDLVLSRFARTGSDGKEQRYERDVTVDLRKGDSAVKTPIGRVVVSANPAYAGAPVKDEMTVDVSKMPMQSTVELYGKKLTGDLVDQDAEVIELSVRDVCVQRAVDILDEILKVYTENWIEDKNKLAVATSAFIDERLRVIQRELGEVDENLARQTAATGTPSLEMTAKLLLEQTGEMDAQILELSNQLAVTRYLRDYIGEKGNEYNVIPVNTGISNPAVEAEIADYNKLLLTRNNLVDNSSTSNPLVRDYDTQLAGLRRAIVNGIDNQISSLSTSIKGVRSELGKTKGRIANTPAQALPLLSEERQQKVKESLYLFLLQKREENQLSQKFTADNTRVITPPMGSLTPVAPKKSLILVMALLVGIAVPVIGVYLAKTGDTKVRSRKDLESMRAPFAGEIPYVGKKENLLRHLLGKVRKQTVEEAPLSIVKEGKRDVVNEAFRVVRSNLEFMVGKGETGRVVMFTSFNPGSGKSFVSFNLAHCLALKHKKVLLVDCDMRHGSASMYVGSPAHGLSDYLSGSSRAWRSHVMEVGGCDGLSILPAGKLPPNPAELLDRELLAHMIGEARSEYDYILLDCPPVNIVVDTQIVAKNADSTVFIVRAGLLDLQAIPELNELYSERKFPEISVILNGTDMVHSRYYTYGNYQNHSEK